MRHHYPLLPMLAVAIARAIQSVCAYRDVPYAVFAKARRAGVALHLPGATGGACAMAGIHATNAFRYRAEARRPGASTDRRAQLRRLHSKLARPCNREEECEKILLY
mmetsp:Transcript_11567/g.26163  ORF Transcript_11567/g.26163 Transcript_11567/m.26163 type:complete len:107 (-) Transcript_11567:204-524(-)